MFDVPARLRERFDECAYWYLSAWEHDPNMQIVNNTITGRDPNVEAHETQMVELFERLRKHVGLERLHGFARDTQLFADKQT